MPVMDLLERRANMQCADNVKACNHRLKKEVAQRIHCCTVLLSYLAEWRHRGRETVLRCWRSAFPRVPHDGMGVSGRQPHLAIVRWLMPVVKVVAGRSL